MANRITNRRNYSFEEYLAKSFKMSNGYTDIFLGALALSAFAVAETDTEKDLALWIACQDQEIKGRGVAGFDISDIPWSKTNFADEMRFLLLAAKNAKAEGYWKPNAPHLYTDEGFLDRFLGLLEDFEVEFVIEENHDEWQHVKPKHEKCSKHDVYLNWAGCIICNQTA